MNPPCPCAECGEWIEETDLFRRGDDGRVYCLECWDYLREEEP